MSTKSKYVFVTLPEFAGWLREAAKILGERVVLFQGPGVPLEHWNGSEEALAAARRVYLTTGSPELAGLRTDELVPGRLGWLQLDVPRSEDGGLMAIQIAAKSDWFDAESGGVLESPVSLRLFDRLWRSWRVHFRFPTWARNLKTGAEAPYPSVGYSTGAAEWFRRGGRLCQDGVGNIEFFLSLPAE